MMTSPSKGVADRTGYLGGSDAAVVLGISPWKSRYRLWCEKTGAEAPPSLDQIDYIYFGHLLEPIVASEFERRLQKKVRTKRALAHHPKHRFIAGHVDRIVLNEEALLECKTSNAFDYSKWGDSGGDHKEIPDYYLAQVDHYMLVTGRPRAYLATLIGGNDFRCYTIERNDLRESQLLEALQEFWKLVLTQTAPEITSEDDAKRRWRDVVKGTAKPIDMQTRALLVRLQRVTEQRKTLEEEEERLRDELFPLFEDRELLAHDGEPVARLTSFERDYFNKKAFEKAHPTLTKLFTEVRKSKRLKILI